MLTGELAPEIQPLYRAICVLGQDWAAFEAKEAPNPISGENTIVGWAIKRCMPRATTTASMGWEIDEMSVFL